MSESTATSLDEAWTRALAHVRNPKEDADNPHFRSRFASLVSVMAPIKEQCAEEGIRYEQREVLAEDGNRYLQTAVCGFGCERKLSVHPIIVARANDPQAFGSALTYARRQAAQLDWGICGEADDDGEAASAQPEPARAEPQPRLQKRDAYIARIGQLQAQCIQNGVRREGLDEWCTTYIGKHIEETNAMTDAELVELGKYLGSMAESSKDLPEAKGAES